MVKKEKLRLTYTIEFIHRFIHHYLSLTTDSFALVLIIFILFSRLTEIVSKGKSEQLPTICGLWGVSSTKPKHTVRRRNSCNGKLHYAFNRLASSPCSKLTKRIKHRICTMGQNSRKHRQNSHPIIQRPTREGVSEASERANKRRDEQMAQYFNLYSWSSWPIVI